MRSIVVSDLHASSGRLDDFDAELEGHFVDFLQDLGSPSESVELIVNGDFLDFVQAPPWSGRDLEAETAGRVGLCFTAPQSEAKLAAIAGSHHPMFRALAALLARSPDNRLVILPGNHDPDFFFASVRDQFSRSVRELGACSDEQIVFHLEPVYHPAGRDDVWIEHGHRSDAVNCFQINAEPCWSAANPPIRQDRHGVERLYECVGTRFLIKYLNRLDAEYPFVDNVKPFSRFLRIFGASAFVPGFGTLKAAFAVWAMLRFLGGTALKRPSDLLGVDSADAPSPSARLRVQLQKSTAIRKKAFADQLVEEGFALGGRDLESLLASDDEALAGFLAEHLDVLDALGATPDNLLSAHGKPGTLTLRKGFAADETADLIAAAQTIAKDHGAKTIVMGHTHEPVSRTGDFTYFNTGSWTRYYKFGAGEKTRPWSLLQNGGFDNFPYELLYVDIQDAGPPSRLLYKERGKDG